jgi:hypothetical protein
MVLSTMLAFVSIGLIGSTTRKVQSGVTFVDLIPRISCTTWTQPRESAKKLVCVILSLFQLFRLVYLCIQIF